MTVLEEEILKQRTQKEQITALKKLRHQLFGTFGAWVHITDYIFTRKRQKEPSILSENLPALE